LPHIISIQPTKIENNKDILEPKAIHKVAGTKNKDISDGVHIAINCNTCELLARLGSLKTSNLEKRLITKENTDKPKIITSLETK
jgi:hypothetical protein